MTESNDSKMVKAGATTYFFDRKQTSEGKPYLVITASRLKGKNGERERTSMAIFPEHAQEFLTVTQQMVKKLG